jgi:hypothetical protein
MLKHDPRKMSLEASTLVVADERKWSWRHPPEKESSDSVVKHKAERWVVAIIAANAVIAPSARKCFFLIILLANISKHFL